jgi:hypothetical protein
MRAIAITHEKDHLLEALFQERDGEGAVLDADSHELCWITTDIAVFDSVLQINHQRAVDVI